MKKVYGTSLNLNLAVNGKTVDFNLRIKNVRLPNQFQTEDTKLQKAIEEHPSFGKTFFLVSTEKPKAEKPVVPPAPAQPNTAPPAPDPAPDNTGNASPTPSHLITTVAGAIKWLVEKKGIDDSELQNIEAVKNMCMLHGVVFPNVAELN